jgi:hypothetical protein
MASTMIKMMMIVPKPINIGWLLLSRCAVAGRRCWRYSGRAGELGDLLRAVR